MAMLPSVAAAIGRWPDAEAGEPDTLEPARGEARMPLARAAVLAASHGGTEVGREVGSAARAGWSILRHRRRQQIPEPVVFGGGCASAADAADVTAACGRRGRCGGGGGAGAPESATA